MGERKLGKKKAKVEPSKATSSSTPQAIPLTAKLAGGVSSNWKQLSTIIAKPKPRGKVQTTSTSSATLDNVTTSVKPRGLPPPLTVNKNVTDVLAVDCEMVGVGAAGTKSALARVCIVNSFGNVIYDKFVKPKQKIVDYRTWISGVRPQDIANAPPFDQVQKEVADMIKDRVIIGHSLEYDLKALGLTHPFALTRDTAKFWPLRRQEGQPRSLKYLVNKILNIDIQSSGSHDPTEDARASMLLYKHLKRDWEEYIQKQIKFRKKKEKEQKSKATKKKKALSIENEGQDIQELDSS